MFTMLAESFCKVKFCLALHNFRGQGRDTRQSAGLRHPLSRSIQSVFGNLDEFSNWEKASLLKLEGGAASQEVDIKCLSGAGCPLVRESPCWAGKPKVRPVVQRLLWEKIWTWISGPDTDFSDWRKVSFFFDFTNQVSFLSRDLLFA